MTGAATSRHTDADMRAAWYQRHGDAGDVRVVGHPRQRHAAPGEVCVRVYRCPLKPSVVDVGGTHA